MTLSVSTQVMRTRITLLIASLGLLTACGASKPRPEDNRPIIEMEPMVLEATGADGEQTVRAYDAQSLFDAGRVAIGAERYDECVTQFGELVNRFPDSRFAHAGLYNRGLCYEELRQHAMAAAHFQRYMELSKTTKDLRDGEFRWGFNLVESGSYTEAMLLYERLLKTEGLGEFDLAECHLRRGITHLRLQRFSEAERDFKETLRRVKQATEGIMTGNDLAAEAHYRRGEAYFELNKNVGLKLPLDRMKDDLAAKSRFFRQAQSSYIDALNVRNAYWATAAGLQLGALYEQFYLDILRAEFPEDFDQATREVYFIELKKYLQPLLKQSVSIYERSMTMSTRLGTDNHWVKETEKRLNKLRSLIEENARAIKAMDDAAAADDTASQAPVKKKPKRRRSRAKNPGS
jgi:tetratricopeptide (TPR) repeat protein